MIHQRKRFNYLAAHQRTPNTSNVVQNERLLKNGCIVSSNLNIHSNKQSLQKSQYQPKFFSRNSSTQKYTQPLNQIQANIPSLDQRNSTVRLFTSSNKENYNQQITNSSYKKQNLTYSIQKQTHQELIQKIRQLEQQNTQLLKETENKFLMMETHLQKVQSILKAKQSIIEKLTQENQKITQENKMLKQENKMLKQENKMLKQENNQHRECRVNFYDEKQEFLRIITDKNKQISSLKNQIQQFQSIQTELTNRIDSLTQQNELLNKEKFTKMSIEFRQIQIQTQTTQTNKISQNATLKQFTTLGQQTDLQNNQIQHLLSKTNQQQSLTNLKLKYETLFKKALEMEDQVYLLKEELFESQTQCKTITKQFNTYKLLYQLQQINQKIPKIPANL